mmetsp:Transcript_24662/g.29864  ORF Transcript_24662/g.29864 Transcript_24662/m.29864 type:complete len:357 (-) Transcript_24662:910-1980(-)|eukprot:CAMPEP_0197845504 /NCGR_PEP_ID=MMETSP1438-20131217/2425_1 /TAXON_ID=1461541 /ORGANISM="Pterosperma sp., Strain CCMP1384" /LENGTH=356 /DNA_ID=CAMNT_0043456823 /DNA_START=593 /DNA_END=1663 /DNA_ORIENTATION=+
MSAGGDKKKLKTTDEKQSLMTEEVEEGRRSGAKEEGEVQRVSMRMGGGMKACNGDNDGDVWFGGSSRTPWTKEALEEFKWRFEEEGVAFVGELYDAREMRHLEKVVMGVVENRPSDVSAVDLLNLHMTDQQVFDLCRHPRALKLASTMLGSDDVSVFTSRILCKLPDGTGKEIPWHQDSHYWPLIPPGCEEISPQVASIWVAVDDVGSDNGPMQFLPYSGAPSSKHQMVKTVDSGGSTKGFNNFNLSIHPDAFPAGYEEKCEWVHLSRGEAVMFPAWTMHRSDANTGTRRRCAWIVRYVPTETRVQGGVRGSFPSDYMLVPVGGKGALTQAPQCDDNDDVSVYAPCYGSAQAALKK